MTTILSQLVEGLAAATAAATPPATGKGAASAAKMAAIRHMKHQLFTATLARYRTAMQGKGWMRRIEVDKALGVGRTGTHTFLLKLFSLGYVDREKRAVSEYQVRCPVDMWRWREEEDAKENQNTL
mgnify:CR=1 FL=1